MTKRELSLTEASILAQLLGDSDASGISYMQIMYNPAVVRKNLHGNITNALTSLEAEKYINKSNEVYFITSKGKRYINSILGDPNAAYNLTLSADFPYLELRKKIDIIELFIGGSFLFVLSLYAIIQNPNASTTLLIIALLLFCVSVSTTIYSFAALIGDFVYILSKKLNIDFIITFLSFIKTSLVKYKKVTFVVGFLAINLGSFLGVKYLLPKNLFSQIYFWFITEGSVILIKILHEWYSGKITIFGLLDKK